MVEDETSVTCCSRRMLCTGYNTYPDTIPTASSHTLSYIFNCFNSNGLRLTEDDVVLDMDEIVVEDGEFVDTDESDDDEGEGDVGRMDDKQWE